MTAVKLAASDLSHHLVYDADEGFDGPRIGSLTELIDLIDHSRALV